MAGEICESFMSVRRHFNAGLNEVTVVREPQYRLNRFVREMWLREGVKKRQELTVILRQRCCFLIKWKTEGSKGNVISMEQNSRLAVEQNRWEKVMQNGAPNM